MGKRYRKSSLKENDATKKDKNGIGSGSVKRKLNKRNKNAKYSDDQIEEARYLDSKAKFIARDRISDEVINTSNKWVGVNNLKYKKEKKSRLETYDIQEIDVEIFDKKDMPTYTENMTKDEKHELTFNVAENDIAKQRKKGIKGPEYRVQMHTRNKNGKKKIVVDNVTRIDTIKRNLHMTRFDVNDQNEKEIVDIYCSTKNKNEFREKLLSKGYKEQFVEEQVSKYKKK